MRKSIKSINYAFITNRDRILPLWVYRYIRFENRWVTFAKAIQDDCEMYRVNFIEKHRGLRRKIMRVATFA